MTTAGLLRHMEIPREGREISIEEINQTHSPYITLSDVDVALYLLKDRGDPTEAYEFLAEHSKDGYSKLAAGVARGDSIFGKGALNYLKDRAANYNVIIDDEKNDNILKDMGKEYFNLLENKVLDSPYGFIDSNITYKEAHEIHKTVFENHEYR